MENHAPLLERAFALDVCEDSYAIDKITGEIPKFIKGIYYLNGPARFVHGDLKYRQLCFIYGVQEDVAEASSFSPFFHFIGLSLFASVD